MYGMQLAPANGLFGLRWSDGQPQDKVITYDQCIWFGGYEKESRELVTVFPRYPSGFSEAFLWPGPMGSGQIQGTSPGTCQFWDQHFLITRKSMDSMLVVLDSLDLPIPSHLIPLEVKKWPGKGNAYLKAQILQVDGAYVTSLDNELAPFADADSNGVYEPEWGDLPDLQNKEQMLWWIMNDWGGLKKYTGNWPNEILKKGGLEFHALAYMYPDVEGYGMFPNTLFFEWKLINQGNLHLDSCFIGLRQDQHFGGAGKGFFCTHPLKNLGITYKKTNFDGGLGGYEADPPAYGTKILQAPGPLADADGFDNNRNGTVDEPLETRLVHSTVKAWYPPPGFIWEGPPPPEAVFFGIFRNSLVSGGPALRYGLDGYGNTDTTKLPCSFLYPNDFDPLGYGLGGTVSQPKPMPPWYHINPDVQGVITNISSGPFSLLPGQSIVYRYCHPIGHGKGSGLANLMDVVSISDSLESILPQLEAARPACNKPGKTAAIVKVFPNPVVNGEVEFYCKDGISEITVLDFQGTQMKVLRPNRKSVRWFLPEIPSGLYLARIRAGNSLQVKKLFISRN